MPIHRTLNHNFFKKWSPEMAYVLGFFAADGNMIRNNRGAHFITFYSTDFSVIEKVRNLLESNHKISTKNRNSKNPLWKDLYQLQLGSKEMFTDLTGLGMTPNKSLTVRMPNVPKEFFPHFLRGYFDGDGHVSVCEYKPKDRKERTVLITGFTSGSHKFLEKLSRLLRGRNIVKGGTLFNADGSRLCFSIKDSLSLYNFMYKDGKDLFLERKKGIFEHYFKIGRVV